jgi:hypothetical protein
VSESRVGGNEGNCNECSAEIEGLFLIILLLFLRWIPGVTEQSASINFSSNEILNINISKELISHLLAMAAAIRQHEATEKAAAAAAPTTFPLPDAVGEPRHFPPVARIVRKISFPDVIPSSMQSRVVPFFIENRTGMQVSLSIDGAHFWTVPDNQTFPMDVAIVHSQQHLRKLFANFRFPSMLEPGTRLSANEPEVQEMTGSQSVYVDNVMLSVKLDNGWKSVKHIPVTRLGTHIVGMEKGDDDSFSRLRLRKRVATEPELQTDTNDFGLRNSAGISAEEIGEHEISATVDAPQSPRQQFGDCELVCEISIREGLKVALLRPSKMIFNNCTIAMEMEV